MDCPLAGLWFLSGEPCRKRQSLVSYIIEIRCLKLDILFWLLNVFKCCSQKHKLMPVSKPELVLNWEMKLFCYDVKHRQFLNCFTFWKTGWSKLFILTISSGFAELKCFDKITTIWKPVLQEQFHPLWIAALSNQMSGRQKTVNHHSTCFFLIVYKQCVSASSISNGSAPKQPGKPVWRIPVSAVSVLGGSVSLLTVREAAEKKQLSLWINLISLFFSDNCHWQVKSKTDIRDFLAGWQQGSEWDFAGGEDSICALRVLIARFPIMLISLRFPSGSRATF